MLLYLTVSKEYFIQGFDFTSLDSGITRSVAKVLNP
jgi:hypothetical protein